MNATPEESPRYYCFDFANGTVEQQFDGEHCYHDDDDDDVEASQSTTKNAIASSSSPSSSDSDSCFSESAIVFAAAEMDTWAVDQVHWLVTHMKLLLLEHLPECVAWIPFAIDRLQQEHEQQQQQKDRRAPQHPGVLWSTQL